MLERFPRSPDNRSAVGRLLEDLSWGTLKITQLREGGRGIENVLTTEVFQALDFLPRAMFLSPLLRVCHGADAARALLTGESEEADITVLPGNAYLRPSLDNHTLSCGVQPDTLIQSPSVYCLVEAKGGRAGASFLPEQLAREFCIARRDAGDRLPLVLLVVPWEPPVPIRGQGKKPIEQAIGDSLADMTGQTEGFSIDPAAARGLIDETVAWITWAEVRACIVRCLSELPDLPELVERSIRRVAMSAVNAVSRHT